jgi:hypothetical protein
MTWWLCLFLSFARAEESTDNTETIEVTEIQDTDADLYRRLLADDIPRQIGSETIKPTEDLMSFPWWGYPLGILGMFGVGLALRRQATSFSNKMSIKVLSRATLGREGSLAVIEVPVSSGSPRRMLIGYGSGSAPRLVADLGEDGVPKDASQYAPLDMVIDDNNDHSERAAMIEDVLSSRRKNGRNQSSKNSSSSSKVDDPWVRDFQKILSEQMNEDQADG